jgi:hypothetical protein
MNLVKMGTTKNLRKVVIPAKAGIQSLVISMSYIGLGTGLRRYDGVFIETAHNMMNKPPLLPRRREPNSVRYEKGGIGSPPSRGRRIFKVFFYYIVCRLYRSTQIQNISAGAHFAALSLGNARQIRTLLA